jgi:hypothetical protein
MQACELQRRVIGLIIAILVTSAMPLWPADIPVKSVTLYKHGIGFFERDGTVAEGDDARLDFKTGDMNDVLKSLTVTESTGVRVSRVRYDSNETVEQRLKRYPFQIGDQELLSTFLDRLKGAHIEIKTSDRTFTGSILSARSIETGPENDRHLVREQVTVLLTSGDVANIDLGSISSFRLLDPKLQEDLNLYLQTLAQAKSRDKRSVYIDAANRGSRSLHVSYIAPTAVWKSSYRLALNETNSILEGWAIIDNTTDEDWNNIKLAVVSGRPISFISALDTPRYGQRHVAELPEDRAAGPVVYGGSLDVAATAGVVADRNGVPAGQGGGMGSGVYSMGNTPAPAPAKAQALAEYARLEASSVQGATGATLGELFEYNFAGPITINRNQSAMLPFLQDKIAARKLLIYTEKDGEHPVNAAEILNSTAKTLDGGPITVYEGGAYAGEALFETVKAGDKRLVGYAVDYGTRVSSAFDTSRRLIREIHVKNGNLELHYGERSTRTYTVRNVDAKPKSLLVQQEGVQEYSVLSPKPTERSATAYRFEVKVPANGAQALKVVEERTYLNTTAVMSTTPDFLMTIIDNDEITDVGRARLKDLADLKTKLASIESSLQLSKTRSEDLTQDQTRLRANIDSLNRVKGQEDQVRKYSAQLADNETQLAKLRDERHDLETRKANAEAEVRKAIDSLDF